MYNPDYWEIIGDAHEDAEQALIDWQNYEEDMKTNPWGY